MQTVFSEPQWTFTVAAEAATYGYVSNLLHVYPAKGRAGGVYVDIPTAFFMLAPKLYAKWQLDAAAKNPLFFYAEEYKDRWILGIDQASGDNFDLWYYTKSNTPPWVDVALRPANRLR